MKLLAGTRGSIPKYYGIILGAIALGAVIMDSSWGRARWQSLFGADSSTTLPAEGPPAIIEIQLPPADRRLLPGDKALFTVVYNRPVTVTGAPLLPIDVGYRRRFARFEVQPTPERLRFSYTIGAGDRDRNGLSPGQALLGESRDAGIAWTRPMPTEDPNDPPEAMADHVTGRDPGIGLLWLGSVHGAAVYSPAPAALPRPAGYGPRVGAEN